MGIKPPPSLFPFYYHANENKHTKDQQRNNCGRTTPTRVPSVSVKASTAAGVVRQIQAKAVTMWQRLSSARGGGPPTAASASEELHSVGKDKGTPAGGNDAAKEGKPRSSEAKTKDKSKDKAKGKAKGKGKTKTKGKSKKGKGQQGKGKRSKGKGKAKPNIVTPIGTYTSRDPISVCDKSGRVRFAFFSINVNNVRGDIIWEKRGGEKVRVCVCVSQCVCVCVFVLMLVVSVFVVAFVL